VRQFKFRAWDKENESMIYPKGILFDGRVVNFGCGVLEPYEGYELMQYTELKDKNETEIYEGDIVKVIHEDGYKTIGQVEWGLSSKGVGTYPAFYIWEFESEMNSFSEIFDTGHYEIEVIGNIYENPELLKEESK